MNILNKLNNIRKIDKNYNKKKAIISTLIIFASGIILGIVSKCLDNLSLDSSIWWHNILGHFDLGNVLSAMGIWLLIALGISVFSKTPFRASLNVFLFFISMNISYHLWTIKYSGFNPSNYMKIWYTLTILSPFIAFICWYAKEKHIVSIVISSFIIGVMFNFCFSIGHYYIYYKSFIDLLIFVGIIAVLYSNAKSTLISLFCGFILSFILSSYIYL